MLEFVTGLFDPSGFPPRKNCGTWTPALIWLHVTSDLFIWLAYLSIPLVLLQVTRRRDLPFPRLFVLFALFIMACGTTHLIDALMFEYPVYRFAGVMKLVTAVVSWATVIALVPVLPQILATVGAPAAGDTTVHRPLAATRRAGLVRDYAIAAAAAVLAILVRAAIDPLIGEDRVFVVGLLAVVYVSWQCGFGPGVACLTLTTVGYSYFFMSPRYTIVYAGVGPGLVIALYFFCGVACAALAESQRVAQRRERQALATAVARQEELETEVARRRVVEAALRQREQELVAAQRDTVAALARLNAFLDHAPMGIAFLDSDLRYVHINPFLAAAHGRPVGAHAGRTVPEMQPDLPPDLLEGYRAVARGERKPFAAVVRRPNPRPGSERVWQITAFPVRDPDGQPVGAGVVAQDVTDRVKAEEDLRRSERNLADFFENANIGLHWVGADGVVLRANRAELKMLGYTRDEYVGRPIAEFHADQEVIRDILDRLQKGEAIDNRRVRLRCKDGTMREALLSATGLWEGGRFVHSRCFTRDVTELTRATEALRESEARFRSMADGAPALIWLSEVDGRRTYFNKTWLEFTGRTAEVEGGTGWADNIHPDDRARYLKEYTTAVAERRPFEVEYRLCRADGLYRWVLARGTPRFTPSGAFAGLVGLCLDVTDRREAAEAVRRSEEQFRTLTEAVPQLVWTADGSGTLQFVNRRWEEFTGLTAAEALLPERQDELLHPDDRDRVRKRWDAVRVRPPDRFAEELRLRRADGAYRWMLSVAVPLRDPAGGVAWVGSLTDIDDQKRHAEMLERAVSARTAELRDANAALSEEVEARRATEQQLRETGAELERSNSELEKFAYVASHDLQEPLRKIQAFCDRLREKCRAALPEPGQEYIDRILTSAARMRRLIDDLLTLSRVTTQKRPFRRVDLAVVVSEVVGDLDVRLAQTGGTLRVGPLPTIDADPTQMRQLFQNLIANAIKFHKPDVPPVVEVAGELLPEPIPDPDTGNPVSLCRLTVRDNGIGFDEKYRDRIFEVFQRLHGRNEYEGTGVGLAICRKIVERHRGTIIAHSREGEGTTFVVTLPVAHSHAQESGDDAQAD